MDIGIRKAFEATMNKDLVGVVISNSANKNEISKIKIRPIILKGEIYYQISEFKGEKIFHNNLSKEALLDHLPIWFEGLFRQAEITTKDDHITMLISKKGKATIKYKKSAIKKEDNQLLLHNKQKNYILTEGTPLPFLVDLGVMTKEGQIVKSKSDKFRQINRFLEYIEDVLPYLDGNKKLTIIDFGCGKSYLTFVMYYYLKVMKNYELKIIGLDLKMDVIDHCNDLCTKYGYADLKFLHGDIATYNGNSAVDMVVSLHACDTATDHALYKAVTWGAKVILSVPCCQHELNEQVQCESLKPILKYGITKERISSLITDALRANLLETKGYKVQLLEFIDMEHTPKNILIRAVKKNRQNMDSENKKIELQNCMEMLGVYPTLQQLFDQEQS